MENTARTKNNLNRTTNFDKTFRQFKKALFIMSIFTIGNFATASVLADWNAVTAKVTKQAGQNSNLATRTYTLYI